MITPNGRAVSAKAHLVGLDLRREPSVLLIERYLELLLYAVP